MTNTHRVQKYYVSSNGKLVQLCVKPSTICRNGYALFYTKTDAYLEYLDRLSEKIRQVEYELLKD